MFCAGLVSAEDGSTIALLILLVIVIVAFILENFVYEQYFRYVFTVFPVFVFALSGIVSELTDIGRATRNLQIASTELAISSVLLLIRGILTYKKFNPQFSRRSSSTEKLDLLDDDDQC